MNCSPIIFCLLISFILPNIKSVSKNDCNIITCNSTKLDSTTAVCGTQTKIDGGDGVKITLQKCPIGYSCHEILGTEKSQVNCSKEEALQTSSSTNLVPGQTCSTNSACFSSQCTEGKCKGKLSEETCVSPQECDVGLSCISGKCTTQRQGAESCVLDFDCLNDYGCDDNGKCVKYFSLANGAETNNDSLCSSFNTRNKDGKSICDTISLKTQSCGDNQDSCVYSYATDSMEIADTCSCKDGSLTQERICDKAIAQKKPTFSTSVHTTLRSGSATDSLLKNMVSLFDSCTGEALFGKVTYEALAGSTTDGKSALCNATLFLLLLLALVVFE